MTIDSFNSNKLDNGRNDNLNPPKDSGHPNQFKSDVTDLKCCTGAACLAYAKVSFSITAHKSENSFHFCSELIAANLTFFLGSQKAATFVSTAPHSVAFIDQRTRIFDCKHSGTVNAITFIHVITILCHCQPFCWPDLQNDSVPHFNETEINQKR